MSKPTAMMLEALCIVPDEWAKCAWPDWTAVRTITALRRRDLIEFRRVREGYQYRRTAHGRDALA